MIGHLNLAMFSLLALAIASSGALKCKFLTVDLSPVNSDEKKGGNETEYECPIEDKNCVVLGGMLSTPPRNLTFALRSCESDVKRFMDPISEKIGQRLDYACQNVDGKNHTVGPVTYWWNCCTSDDCNSGVLGHYTGAAFLSLLSFCLLFGSLLVAY